MRELEHLCKEVERWGHELLGPLQTTKEINEAAFERLNETAKALARQLKGSEMIPRRAIDCLYVTMGILKNEADYSRDKERVMQMALAVNQAFGAILEGLAVEDRKPLPS